MEISTEERIKKAAKKIFTEKGLAGARMQDIADHAGINKAMLHYYFRSKQKLFEIIFEEQLTKMVSALNMIIRSDYSFKDKVREFVDKEIEIIGEFPMLPLFVLGEALQNPGILEEKLKEKLLPTIKHAFNKLINREIEAGRMAPISPEQFMMNLVSLCIYPLLAKPLIKTILQIDDPTFDQLMEDRKKEIPRWLFQSIEK